MLPFELQRALEDTAAMLQRKADRPFEGAIHTLAQSGNESAIKTLDMWNAEDGALPVPTMLHDGSDITSLTTLAATMGVDKVTAAYYALESKEPLAAEVIDEAHWVVANPSWGDTATLMWIPDGPERYAWDGPGALKTGDMHCTLAYYGSTRSTGMSGQEFLAFAKEFVRDKFAPTANINGQTVFINDGARTLVLNVDGKNIEDQRMAVLAESGRNNLVVNREHGYSPHITVAELPDGVPVPSVLDGPLEETFSRLRVSWGGEQWDLMLPKAGTPIDPEGQEVKVVRHVRTAGGVRRYKQPIGSVIVADVIPNVARMASGETLKRTIARPRKAGAPDRVKGSGISKKHFDRSYLQETDLDWAHERGRDHLVLVSPSDRYEPSIETVNIVNAALSVYSHEFGPIHGLLGSVYTTDEHINTGTDSSDYLAFNDIENHMRSPFTGRKVGVIGVHPDVFPAIEDPARTDPLHMTSAEWNAITDSQEGFTAYHVNEIQDSHKITKVEALRLAILHHEFGHTVAYIVQDKKITNLRRGMDPWTKQRIAELRQQILELIAKNNGLSNSFQTSVYGTTNIDEHLAEVWAAYMLNTTVTEHIKQVGDLMAEAFREFLDDYNERHGIE